MNRMTYLKIRGLSLIELMVAMVIGLVLILGVTVLLVDSQSTRLAIMQNSESQEGGQILFALLRKDVQMAGYRGCNTAVNLGSDLGDYLEGISLNPAAADLPPDLDLNSSKVSFFYFRPYPDAANSEVTVAGKTVTLSTSDIKFPRAGGELVIGNCSTQETIIKPPATSDTNTFTIAADFKGKYEYLGGFAPDQVHLYQKMKRTYSVAKDSKGESLFLGKEPLLENLVSSDSSDDSKPEFIFSENKVGGVSTKPKSYNLAVGIAGGDKGKSTKIFKTIIIKKNQIREE